MVLLNVVQLLNLPLIFLGEKKSATPYGKFAAALQADKKEKMIPSKVGMLIIYVPALVVASLYVGFAGSDSWLQEYSANAAAWMTMLHFLKRTLETLFLHKYSGSTSDSAAKMIGFAYALQTAMVCGTSTSSPSEMSLWISSILFSVGIVGNFYHHYLANLRSIKSDRSKYVAPRGGLFQFVAGPHYLFELIGWLGIAVVSEQITPYLIFGGMVGYLSARSANQNAWNHARFSEKEWPTSRRNLIPMVF
jgi:protein-S-isoprenylcysteine O-methyltransferase Ste14